MQLIAGRCPFCLRQHRIMETSAFAGSFVPIVQCEKLEIHPVFPHFPHFCLKQNLSPKALVPLCGIALRQHRTIASADLSGSFVPFLQFQKREIHTVFPRFWNFELAQNLSLSFLAELCGVALFHFTRFLTEQAGRDKMNPVPFGTGRCQTLRRLPPIRG